ncbi:MAG: gluconokinase [Bacteroidia bacterium]|nr:gluconokinase [Bacteroidia bacterium]
MVLIFMGVSGSGKTTLGQLAARQLDCPFYDGDDFHPEANIRKMSAGEPLSDADRIPWLLAIREVIERHLDADTDAVVACSALREAYREVLSRHDRRVRFVYLKGSRELLQARMQARGGHFMPPALLQSQLDTLEEPAGALVLDIGQPPEALLAQLMDIVQVRGGLRA